MEEKKINSVKSKGQLSAHKSNKIRGKGNIKILVYPEERIIIILRIMIISQFYQNNLEFNKNKNN